MGVHAVADALVSISEVGFSVSLLPIMIAPWSAVPRRSSVSTSALLYVTAVGLGMAGLWWGAALDTVVATQWAIIALRRGGH